MSAKLINITVQSYNVLHGFDGQYNEIGGRIEISQPIKKVY